MLAVLNSTSELALSSHSHIYVASLCVKGTVLLTHFRVRRTVPLTHLTGIVYEISENIAIFKKAMLKWNIFGKTASDELRSKSSREVDCHEKTP